MTTLSHTKANKSQRQDFLLSFFSKPDKFDVREVNGFVLNKYQSNQNGFLTWAVMIFTKDSWKKSREYVQLNHPGRIKDPQRKTKFNRLLAEISSAIQR